MIKLKIVFSFIFNFASERRISLYNVRQSRLRNAAAAALCIALVFVFSISFAYIIEEANHDCSGDNCPICAAVHVCENNVRADCVISTSVFSTLFLSNIAEPKLNITVQSFDNSTPISSEVRLND